MKILQKQVLEYLQWGIAASFSFGLYFILLIVFRVEQPDLDDHIVISENMFKDWRVPAHPLFYSLIQLLSFFSKNHDLEVFAAFLVFSLTQFAKILISKRLIEEVFNYTLDLFGFLVLVMAQLVISFSVFEKYFIINQICPNFFHNGTLQLSIPFVLLLLLEAWRFAKGDEKYSIKKMLLYGLLVALSKPSFLFCFIPVFPAYILYVNGIGRKLLASLQVSTLFTFIIMGQSFYLRMNPHSYLTSFKIAFLPFFQFGSLQSHMSMMVYGLFIPIIAFCLKPQYFQDRFVQFLLVMLVLSFAISFSFVDVLNGVYYSNMTWQTSVIMYLLLAFGLGCIFKPGVNGLTWKQLVFSIAVLANAVYSLIYFFYAVGMKTLFI